MGLKGETRKSEIFSQHIVVMIKLECNFECYKFSCNRPYKRPPAMVSSSAFIQSGGKETIDTTKYTSQLVKLAKTLHEYTPPGTALRLYIDRRIADNPTPDWKEVIEKLNEMEHVYIIVFECPSVMGEKGEHMGLFGTLLRFLPICVTPGIPEWAGGLPLGTPVCMSDVDDSFDRCLKRWVLGNMIAMKGYDIYGFTRLSNAPRHNFFNLDMPTLWVGFVVYINFRFPWKVISSVVSRAKVIGPLLRDLNEKIGSDPQGQVARPGGFIYGLDEIVVNSVLFGHLVRQKKTYKILLVRFERDFRDPYQDLLAGIKKSISADDSKEKQDAILKLTNNILKNTSIKKEIGTFSDLLSYEIPKRIYTPNAYDVDDAEYAKRIVFRHTILSREVVKCYLKGYIDIDLKDFFLYFTHVSQAPRRDFITYHMDITIGDGKYDVSEAKHLPSRAIKLP